MIYLSLLIAVILCMVALDARFRLFVFHRPLPAIAALLLGTGFFLVWDLAAIAEGIFLHIDSPLMTGVMLAPQLPLEEFFFLLFLCYQTMVLATGFEMWRTRRAER
ncbi:MAG TPA: lycopene cyclase domain-containing protein [Brevibacterium sp.]|nr:lycopene cyclase domain-containing protein [Brevibacterium sp.]